MKWTTKDLVYMALYAALFIVLDVAVNRSEERRVGKECRL